MPSTYSPSLRLELIGNGEQAGTWGTTTNNNLGTLIEQAIAGVQPITLTGGDYTLTDFNGLPDQSRNAVLILNGLLAAPCNVIAPSSEKVYIVRNFSNATVTIKTATGNGVALTNAASAVVFCDGTDFYSATTLNYIDGNLTVTGTTNLQGAVTTNSTVTIGGSVTITSNTASIFANASSGQVFLPVGTDAQRSSTPTNGLIRYNTQQNFYEGYANNTWVRFLVANQGSFTLFYHLVGGGAGVAGSGGAARGGGGAGQVLENSVPTSLGTVFTITVAAGGAAGSAGGTTTLSGVTSAVGGGASSVGTGGTSGNGFGGGGPFIGPDGVQTSGGGGGAGQGGGAGSEGLGGTGGNGIQTNITGTPTYYGGGGAGGGQFGAAAPGLGGGGAAATAGTVNTGGGGGGCYGGQASTGGSGQVIIKVLTLYYSGTYTGTPTITTIGDYTCLRYTASGTYTA